MFRSLPRLIVRKPRSTLRQPQSVEEAAAVLAVQPDRGAAGFVHFCDRFVIIQDKESEAEVPLRLWPGQLRIATDLVAGVWLLLLKGRQQGMTWEIAAYVVWRIVTAQFVSVITVILQERQYAQDFLDRVLWIHDRLPPYLRRVTTKQNEQELNFGAGRRKVELRAMVGSGKTARSITGDLCICDEASRIEGLKKVIAAASPGLIRTLRTGRHGQMICLSTTDGPIGDFYDLWCKTYGESGELLDANGVGPTRFKPFFLHWSERPGRDAAWYAEQCKALDQISPVARMHEFPNTIEEAWEHAEGRVYPLFSRQHHVGVMDIPGFADRFRAIDWGETKSAFVVLWIAYVRGAPGLLVHPSCHNTIRELLGYRFDEHGRPVKENDHACDALRYAVVHHELKGLVYIYREVYRLDSVQRGWNPIKEIDDIHLLSGWSRNPEGSYQAYSRGRDGERYSLTSVADPSQGKIINLFNSLGIPCDGCRPLGRWAKGKLHADKDVDQRTQGIRMVSALIDGTLSLGERYVITREQRISAEAAKHAALAGRLVKRADAERLAELAKAMLAGKRVHLRDPRSER